MSFQVKEEQFSDDEEQVEGQQQQQVQRVDVKAEDPVEYLLIIPPKEEPKEKKEENENGEQATTSTTKTTNEDLKCDHFDCDFIGKTRRSLLRHQKSHTKPLECKDCNKRFSTKRQLNNHRLVKHENPNAFQCKVCNKSLSSKRSLKNHSQTHEENPAKPFKCLKCQKSFRLKELLKLHQMSKHSDSKPLVCDLCPKRFSILMQIRSHVENHKKEKRFKCEVCMKSFTFKNNFNDHLERHSGVKVKCDLCDAEFLTKIALSNHKSYMHSDRSFKCDKCGYVAKNSKLLRAHQEVHKEWKEADFVECLKCYKKYRNIKALRSHNKQVHIEKQFTCDHFNCNYVGKTKYELNRHEASHDKKFDCNICEKLFSSKSELKNHISIKHEDPDRFKCHVCDKRLNSKQTLRRHLQTHEVYAEKQFSCEQCPKSYQLKEALKQHQQQVHGEN